MRINLANILSSVGLNDKESAVYLSALSLGPSTILKIAKDSGLKRTTVYSVIENLKQQGLMSIEIHGWKQLFVAENPKKLEQILENRKEAFKKNLPEFLSLYNLKADESALKYFEGLEAVKSIYEELLQTIKPHEDYLVIARQEAWLGLDSKYFLDFIKRRAKLNINIRMLLQDSAVARDHQKYEQNFNEKIKILPPNNPFTTNLVITPQRLVMHQLVPPIMAIVIENQNIIKMNQEMFNLIWDNLK